MASMSDLIAEHSVLDEAQHQWLRLLVTEWPLVADLSFTDLVLWVPDLDENVYRAAAQIRPTTGPTALLDDVVEDTIAYAPEHLVSEAFMSARSPRPAPTGCRRGCRWKPTPSRWCTAATPSPWSSSTPVCSASASRAHSNGPTSIRRRIWPRWCRRRAFPVAGDQFDPSINPRVGDGFIRLDADGSVVYASPNALSAYRRLGLRGDLVDEHLASLTAALLPPRRAGGRLGAVGPVGADRPARRGGRGQCPLPAPLGARW